MNRSIAAFILLSLLAALPLTLFRMAFAEEVSVTDARALYQSRAYRNRAVIPELVRTADVAGIGRFLNEPSPEAPSVQIAVDAYWTESPGTDVIEVDASRSLGAPDWEYPTNIPVVFFAIHYGSLSNVWSNGGIDLSRFADETQNAKLIFSDSPRAWFRVERDGGILHEFATNLWECVRTNPDEERYYEVLRDYAKTPFATSSRVAWDADATLYHFLFSKPDDYLFDKKNNDPDLSPEFRNSIRNILLQRRWTLIDGVWHEPEPIVPPPGWTEPP